MCIPCQTCLISWPLFDLYESWRESRQGCITIVEDKRGFNTPVSNVALLSLIPKGDRHRRLSCSPEQKYSRRYAWTSVAALWVSIATWFSLNGIMEAADGGSNNDTQSDSRHVTGCRTRTRGLKGISSLYMQHRRMRDKQ